MKTLHSILEGLLTGSSDISSSFNELDGIIESLKTSRSPKEYDTAIRFLLKYIKKTFRTKDIKPTYNSEKNVFAYDIPARSYTIHAGKDFDRFSKNWNTDLYTYLAITSYKIHATLLLNRATHYDKSYKMWNNAFFTYDGDAKSEEYGYESEYILIMDDAGKEFIDKLIDSLPDSE